MYTVLPKIIASLIYVNAWPCLVAIGLWQTIVKLMLGTDNAS